MPGFARHVPDPHGVVPLVVGAAERYGIDPLVLANVAFCESRLDPAAVGDGGYSYGLFQLYRWGLLPEFYRRGYIDPFDPRQAADFAAWMFRRGLAWNWTCWRVLYGRGW
ncbi:MAG: transglycosylase SLT domain-containing protein [Chloroflexi bacterium]|nr:transglycosylase SLT domain-containing protein [Chloroflexota bacterium]